MATIYVKTKEGRMAFYNGKPIPHDKFIPVQETSGVQRLVKVWEDVLVDDKTATPQGRKGAPFNPAPKAAEPKKETN
jgi:hypothetical protein